MITLLGETRVTNVNSLVLMVSPPYQSTATHTHKAGIIPSPAYTAGIILLIVSFSRICETLCRVVIVSSVLC